MALSQIPGYVGYHAERISSFDQRAIGKFTDTNHLYSLHDLKPSEYDKKIISLYTQTSLYSNDFLNMLNQSTPMLIDSESWFWKVGVPYRYPVILSIPTTTQNMAQPGIDGQPFQFISDKPFFIHQNVTPDRRYGSQWYIIQDPEPVGAGWLHTATLVTNSPRTDYVDSRWLRPGTNLQVVDIHVGEFDQELPGLPELGQKITLYETMAAGYGFQHSITKWANQLSLKDEKGNPKNVMVYTKYRVNETGKPQALDVRWEPFVETLMRQHMSDLKVQRFIWGKPGTSQSYGTQQEVKKSMEGLYWKIRNHGHYVTYNRGEFTINLMRSVYGDLFYRRVDIQDRKVRVYTNEAGMEVFSTALKQDMMGSGLTVVAGVNDKFIKGEGQNLTVDYRFNKLITLDTGPIELIHLKELDQPQTNEEYGQNKKSTPVFLVFDISPESDGTPKNNIREIRLRQAPSMTWGYINGRTHYQGHQASQGMISSSMDPKTTVWMEDRCDLFVEDLSRMVLIEEIPLF